MKHFTYKCDRHLSTILKAPSRTLGQILWKSAGFERFLGAACFLKQSVDWSFTMVVVGFSQDDLGGTVNGVNFLFLDGLDSLDSK